ncbi:MAG: hypothetical protein ACLP8S_25100 [Solirubrobacteraceae bacterium]
MTENSQSSTDQAEPPAPWLQQQTDAGSLSNWAMAGAPPGTSWPPPPSSDPLADGAPAGQSPLQAGQASLQAGRTSLQSLVRARPELVIGAAFAGGLAVALIVKRLAR